MLISEFVAKAEIRFEAKLRHFNVDVLYCLALDALAVEQTFEEWCDDLGFDPDSRRALATFGVCRDTAAKLTKIFGIVGLAELFGCEEG